MTGMQLMFICHTYVLAHTHIINMQYTVFHQHNVGDSGVNQSRGDVEGEILATSVQEAENQKDTRRRTETDQNKQEAILTSWF